jgi:hypothetical protein
MDPIVYGAPGFSLTLLFLTLLGGCESSGVRQEPDPLDTARTEEVPPPGTPYELDTVLVHFTRGEEPYPIEREVRRTSAVLREALEQQLAGPTSEERNAFGLTSWFSEETSGMLRSVILDEGGHAVVDFGDFSGIIPNASSSLGSTILLGELNATVFQFPAVRSVEYRFEGSCDAFANWLQLGCEKLRAPAARGPARGGAS